MATERGQVADFVLDALRRDQDRLIRYMTAGFVVGFIIGVVSAWMLIALH
jgi:hypothetical protein